MPAEETTSLVPVSAKEADFSREDAVQAISDELRRGQKVHFKLGEHWTAVLSPAPPEIPASGDMQTLEWVSVFLQIAIPAMTDVRFRQTVTKADAILPGVIVLGCDLGNPGWGIVTSIEGVFSTALVRHTWIKGETLSDAVKNTLQECNSIFSSIAEHHENKRRAEESRNQSIERALAEYARRMSL